MTVPVARYGPEANAFFRQIPLMLWDGCVQNLITRLNYDANLALKEQGDTSSLRGGALTLLKYLLFVEETPLVSPINGPSGFAQWFESQGPTDKQGGSLRQFDLQTRLFKYPC